MSVIYQETAVMVIIAQIAAIPSDMNAITLPLQPQQESNMIQFPIKNRFTGEVNFTAEQCGTKTGESIPINGFQFIADLNSPRERWFMMIRPGHTPENNVASKEALAWLDEAISIRDHIRKVA